MSLRKLLTGKPGNSTEFLKFATQGNGPVTITNEKIETIGQLGERVTQETITYECVRGERPNKRLYTLKKRNEYLTNSSFTNTSFSQITARLDEANIPYVVHSSYTPLNISDEVLLQIQNAAIAASCLE